MLKVKWCFHFNKVKGKALFKFVISTLNTKAILCACNNKKKDPVVKLAHLNL